MIRRAKAICASLVVLLFISVSGAVFAQRPTQGIGQWLQEVGFFTGYIKGPLKVQRDFEAIPLGLRFGFDLKPFTKKFGFQPPGKLELVYEPFISTIAQPRSNVEMGLGIFLKYAYPLTQNFYPYIEAGAGPYYMTLHTYEQSTQFNFVDQGGAGFYYFIKDDLAINLGFRYRHVSNSGIKHPNGGFEDDVYLIGVSRYF
jgi:lipid A 3-O-deacylase